MSGIPTVIDGVTYRSRIEARWAIMLEHLFPGRVEYEPFDADGYIPDFAILGDAPLLIEVKSHLTLAELAGHVDRVEKAIDGHWTHDVMIVGGTPFIADSPSWGATYPSVGLMTNRHWEPECESRWESANWVRCKECGAHGWFNDTQWYGVRPCGHSDGDHHMLHPDREQLGFMWADAQERSRWTPGAARRPRQPITEIEWKNFWATIQEVGDK